jgi:MFS transporter, PAT family, beta-lactamase induction signal transducer AmpG
MQKKIKPDGKTLLWVNSTYFAEGLPFMVVRILSSLYFTQLGVRELYLGYLNYLGIPWNLKFLWAPFIDAWGTKRMWQIVFQSILGLGTFLLAYLSYCAGGTSDPSSYLVAIAMTFVVMAFVAASNDIAIDGYYLEALPSQNLQALLSGYRVLAYRLAMVFARSGLVGVVAYSASRFAWQENPAYAWIPAFVIAGGVLLCCALLHKWILPVKPRVYEVEDKNAHTILKRGLRVSADGFRSYLAQPRIGIILSFIVLYKLGDEVLFSMVSPFLLREIGITTEQYAWIAGIVGAAGTIVGAMVGGWWIHRVGLRKALWPLSILMNVTIWLYVWLSVAKPDPSTLYGELIVCGVHGIEQIAAGLGNAALLVFLLSTCSPKFRATHYAIGSAIMSIPGTVIGGEAGRIVEMMGYRNLYIAAFVLSIPAMCLIPIVPIQMRDDD